jgi:hypothetical protein
MTGEDLFFRFVLLSHVYVFIFYVIKMIQFSKK